MNKAELVEEVANQTGLKKKTSREVVGAIISAITDFLREDIAPRLRIVVLLKISLSPVPSHPDDDPQAHPPCYLTEKLCTVCLVVRISKKMS